MEILAKHRDKDYLLGRRIIDEISTCYEGIIMDVNTWVNEDGSFTFYLLTFATDQEREFYNDHKSIFLH